MFCFSAIYYYYASKHFCSEVIKFLFNFDKARLLSALTDLLYLIINWYSLADKAHEKSIGNRRSRIYRIAPL